MYKLINIINIMTNPILFSLNGREDLLKQVMSEIYKLSSSNITIVGDINKQKFSDGELCVDFVDSVRGKLVYLITSPNTSDEIMKLILAIDAAKRGGADKIIPILPYFPYARQDKKDQSRGPIGAKVLANMLMASGATGIITFDLHADQIQGFFDIPITHLEGRNIFDSYIASIVTPNTVLCGPDAGSGKRVKRMQKSLLSGHEISLNYVMMDKTRTEANKIDEMVIIGNVEGKDVIIIDDMCDTAGTLCAAADELIKHGAKSVRAVISHGVFSGPAYKRIFASKLSEVIISDSLAIPKEIGEQKEGDYVTTKINTKIRVVSLATQIAMAMGSINNHMSYEALKSLSHA